MPSNNYNEKEGYTRIFLVIAIIACLIFMVFAAYSSVRLNTDDGFGKNYYRDYSNKPTTNFLAFSDTESYLLQNFSINDKDNILYNFCFEYNYTLGSGAKVSILNKDLDIIGTAYLTNSSNYICSELDISEVKEDNFIGIRCDSCSASNTFYLMEELSGDNAIQVYYDGSDISVSEETTLNYIIVGERDYQSMFRLFLIWFIILLIVLFIGFIAIGGINELYNFMYENFGGNSK